MEQRIDFGTKIDPKGAMRGKEVQPETFKSLDNDQKLDRKLKYLKSRFQQINQKLNEATAKNKGLREQIDAYRRERVIYDKIYRDLEYDYLLAKQ